MNTEHRHVLPIVQRRAFDARGHAQALDRHANHRLGITREELEDTADAWEVAADAFEEAALPLQAADANHAAGSIRQYISRWYWR